MADGPVYGYPQRPPMPDRFVPGAVAVQGSSPSASIIPVVQAIAVPRNQLPRSVEKEVKYGDLPSMMIGWPQHRGVIVENTTITVPDDTVENTMKSTLIAPGTLGPKGGWKLTASGRTLGGQLKTVRVYWGGILIATLSVAQLELSWTVEISCWNQNDTQSQVITVRLIQNGAVGSTTASVIEVGRVLLENVETA